MKMKKIFLSLLAGLLLTTTAVHAGSYDEEIPKHEVSVSYGVAPYTQVANDFASLFSRIFVAGFTGKVETKNKKSWGAINADYNYHLRPWFGVGANMSYSTIEGDIKQGDKTGTDKETYVTIMANVKMDWYRRKHITLYSRLSAGVMLENDKVTSGSTTETKSDTKFMGQLSPIGLELGSKNFRYFTEFGFGQAGIFQAGLRARF